MLDSLTAEYDVERKTAKADLENFLKQLSEKGLLENDDMLNDGLIWENYCQ